MKKQEIKKAIDNIVEGVTGILKGILGDFVDRKTEINDDKELETTDDEELEINLKD